MSFPVIVWVEHVFLLSGSATEYQSATRDLTSQFTAQVKLCYHKIFSQKVNVTAMHTLFKTHSIKFIDISLFSDLTTTTKTTELTTTKPDSAGDCIQGFFPCEKLGRRIVSPSNVAHSTKMHNSISIMTPLNADMVEIFRFSVYCC